MSVYADESSALATANVPAGGMNLNVDGRQVAGALQGFGQMWQKTYRVRLSGAKVTPAQVIRAWRGLSSAGCGLCSVRGVTTPTRMSFPVRTQ